jgi:hypothetical protein
MRWHPAVVHRQVVNSCTTFAQRVGQQFAAAVTAHDSNRLAADVSQGGLGEQVLAVVAVCRANIDNSRGRFDRCGCCGADGGDGALAIPGKSVLDRITAYVDDDIRLVECVDIRLDVLRAAGHDFYHRKCDALAAGGLDGGNQAC